MARIILFVLLGLTLTGCTQVAFIRHADEKSLSLASSKKTGHREVHYHIKDSFFMSPPNCVMVLPVTSRQLPTKISNVVEDTVSRHLSVRFNRVIGARHVLTEIRRRVLNSFYTSDLKRLSLELDCDAYAEIDAAQVERFFAAVWTEVSVEIGLAIFRAKDGEALWRGSHRARRGDGGLPVSVFGAGLSTFEAGRLAGDNDALPSIVDDTVRRMVVSLPDVRRF